MSKCSGIVDGFNPKGTGAGELYVEAQANKKLLRHTAALKPFGITYEERMEWYKNQPKVKFLQDPELKQLALERFNKVVRKEVRKNKDGTVYKNPKTGLVSYTYVLDKQAYDDTQQEWLDAVKRLKPIVPLGEVPPIPTIKEVAMALDAAKLEKGIIVYDQKKANGKHLHYIPDGTIVRSRLDIPAYENTNTWVVSLRSDSYKGTKYGQVARLKNVRFPVTDSERIVGMKIASGQTGKDTYATMNGEWQNITPESAKKIAELGLSQGRGWVEIGMNPHRDVDFYRKDTGERIYAADEVIQIGALVLAQRPLTYDPALLPDPDKSNVFHRQEEIKIELEGEVGQIIAEKTPALYNPWGKSNDFGEWHVSISGIDPKLFGKGVGLRMYLSMIEEVLKRPEIQYLTNDDTTSEAAMNIWRKIHTRNRNLIKIMVEEFPQLKGTFTSFSNEGAMEKDGNVYIKPLDEDSAYTLALNNTQYKENLKKLGLDNRKDIQVEDRLRGRKEEDLVWGYSPDNPSLFN